MTAGTFAGLAPVLYLVSAVLFILGLKGMTRVTSARRGNALASAAMLLAIATTLVELGNIDYRWILLGLGIGAAVGGFAAVKVAMTAMPEMVALFNGCGGAASTLVALSVLWLEVVEPGTAAPAAEILGVAPAVTVFLSVLIGGVTFTGSLLAFLKLSGRVKGRPIVLPGRHFVNAAVALAAVGSGAWLSFGAAGETAATAALVASAASLVLGILMVLPIGGADMPVVISLLNSLSGVAASATGFVIGNNLLVIAGALVGASGLILTQIMCKAMNRPLANVLFSGFGDSGAGSDDSEYTNVRSFSAEEAALVLETAERVVVVPGYGLAVAQAQHLARQLADLLESRGSKVTYAIHPVAGRMPGHMNVLLAEADVPYEQLVEMDRANPEFKSTDVVLVVGANDVVNPAAREDSSSPIYGMPILEVGDAGMVIVIKRSLSPGFAGIKNGLFEAENAMMIFGDAKQVLQDLVTELKQLLSAA